MKALPLAAVVVAVFIASPLHLPLNNPNEGVRVFTVKALVEEHTFAIENVQRAWGFIDDKSAKDGHLYSSKAPLMSLLGAAAYAVVHPFSGDLSRPALTRLCRGFADALPCLALAFVLWRALRRRVEDPVVADLVVVGTVLGTGALASMNVFSGHAVALLGPAAALALVAPSRGVVPGWGERRGPRVLAHAAGDAAAPSTAARLDAGVQGAPGAGTPLNDASARNRTRYVVAGLALAAAVGAEYPALLACVPVVALALVRAPTGVGGHGVRPAVGALGWLVAGAAPIVVAVCAAHSAMFGAPWRTGYSFLENESYQHVVAGTLFGIGAPHLDVLGTVLFSPEVGLFFFSPFLVAGVAALPFLWRSHRALVVTVAAGCALMLLFIAGFRGWRGGWSVGPRYISEVAGLLALPTALGFDALKSRLAARAVLAALVAVALVHSGVAGMFFPHLSDVFKNPVFEMMLPVVGLGFAPGSIPLALGLAPALSAAVVVAALFVPLVLAVAVDRRTALVALASAALALGVDVVVAPHLAHTDPAAAALEARRMLDNWRPDAGDPLLDGTPRSLVAVDRARVAWPAFLRDGCAPASTPPTPPRGPLAAAAAQAPAGALVVVPDRFALSLAGVRGAPALFVAAADVEREARLGLPCSGSVYAVRGRGDGLPRPLRNLRVAGARDVGGGLSLVELAREAPSPLPR